MKAALCIVVIVGVIVAYFAPLPVTLFAIAALLIFGPK